VEGKGQRRGEGRERGEGGGQHSPTLCLVYATSLLQYQAQFGLNPCTSRSVQPFLRSSPVCQTDRDRRAGSNNATLCGCEHMKACSRACGASDVDLRCEYLGLLCTLRRHICSLQDVRNFDSRRKPRVPGCITLWSIHSCMERYTKN